jgi:hypothetical protein
MTRLIVEINREGLLDCLLDDIHDRNRFLILHLLLTFGFLDVLLCV